MNKNNIELKLINNNVDLKSINAIQLISFVMEEIETIKDINGKQKKLLVISILHEFTNDDNIFSKADNIAITTAINNLLDTQIASDIIDTIVACADGAIKINEKIKASCFCFSKK